MPQETSSNPDEVATILVVEDELFVRILISDALRDEGYEVVEAFNADEAVDVLNSGVRVDLVFSDVRMPGSIDGLGLLAFVRRKFADLPVLITSGHFTPALALAEGASLFVRKPYSVTEALEMIATTLGQVQ